MKAITDTMYIHTVTVHIKKLIKNRPTFANGKNETKLKTIIVRQFGLPKVRLLLKNE